MIRHFSKILFELVPAGKPDFHTIFLYFYLKESGFGSIITALIIFKEQERYYEQ